MRGMKIARYAAGSLMPDHGLSWLLMLGFVSVALAGCSGSKGPGTAGAGGGGTLPAVVNATIPADADPWIITTTDPKAASHPFLGNGYVGFRTGALGTGDGPKESELCLVAGNYRKDGLQPLASPADVTIKLGSEVLDPASSRISGYKQTLNMHDGVLVTDLTWETGGKSIPLTITTFAWLRDPHLVMVHVSGPTTPGLEISHTISGATGPASDTYYEAASDGGPAVAMEAAAVTSPGDRLEWTGYTLIETSDETGRGLRSDVKVGLGELLALEPPYSSTTGNPPHSYTYILNAQKDAWHELWQSDITIQGDPATQQMVHAALFYLLESTRAGGQWSIPPMGLSNTTWNGHIFWDAPMWMFPALSLLHPAEARSMVDYAVRMLPQAKALAAKEGLPGASYPWESARSGGEAAEAIFAQERHVTADVANMIWRYYLITGDKDWLRKDGYPVLSATATYWSKRMTPGPDGKMHIRQVVGPDEIAGLVDDDAFTNGVVRVNLEDAVQAAHELGLKPPAEWAEKAGKLFLPFDAKQGIYLAHAGYSGSQIKQADPSLLIYPLGLVTDSQVIGKMLDYYPGKVEAGGPAMTDSIYATIAARQGKADQAFSFFQKSYQPFLVPPFDQISEKHSRVRQYCFVTGLGGLVQSVLYGFGGLSVDGAHLTAQGRLPSGWSSLVISGLHFRGKVYNLNVKAGSIEIKGS